MYVGPNWHQLSLIILFIEAGSLAVPGACCTWSLPIPFSIASHLAPGIPYFYFPSVGVIGDCHIA